VREQQYALAQAQLEQTRRLVDAGQRAQVEIVRAEAGVAQQLEAIIVAENSLRDRERELKRVSGKPASTCRRPRFWFRRLRPIPSDMSCSVRAWSARR